MRLHENVAERARFSFFDPTPAITAFAKRLNLLAERTRKTNPKLLPRCSAKIGASRTVMTVAHGLISRRRIASRKCFPTFAKTSQKGRRHLFLSAADGRSRHARANRTRVFSSLRSLLRDDARPRRRDEFCGDRIGPGSGSDGDRCFDYACLSYRIAKRPDWHGRHCRQPIPEFFWNPDCQRQYGPRRNQPGGDVSCGKRHAGNGCCTRARLLTICAAKN